MTQYDNSKIDFKNPNIKVDIITTTPGMSAPISRKITEIWTDVFAKMNYDSTLVINSSLPFSKIM
jgi:hypothetical protein